MWSLYLDLSLKAGSHYGTRKSPCFISVQWQPVRREFFFTLAFKLLTGWMRLIHIMKGKLLYSVSPFKSVISSQKCTHRDTQSNISLGIWTRRSPVRLTHKMEHHACQLDGRVVTAWHVVVRTEGHSHTVGTQAGINY